MTRTGKSSAVKRGEFGLVAVFLTLTQVFPPVMAQDVNDVFELSLEELLSIEVTSVSKRPQQLKDAPAAIHVITREDILRSGVTSVAEALRLAPGIQVARINAHTWAISSRGFNSQWSNKLLVMVDGRSIYVPSYSGVYWEQQDLVLADIDRIEVIRGPGATIWGANAVNGVINILTRPTADTGTALASLGFGSSDRSQAALRIGTAIGDTSQARFYLKYQDTTSFTDWATGDDARDDWRSATAGIRIDGERGDRDRWTVHGDVYRLDASQRLIGLPAPVPPYTTDRIDEFEASGWNMVGRWQHEWGNRGETSLQFYLDHFNRTEDVLQQHFDTFDVELQHQFALGTRHDLVAGIAQRLTDERYGNTFNVAFSPADSTRSIYSAFLQDDIALLRDKLHLIVGAKLEYNEDTKEEFQPSVRVLWRPNDRSTFWGAVSRAVRTPSRIEVNGRIVSRVLPLAPPPAPPVEVSVNGKSDLGSETLIAYELGYRVQPGDSLSIDVAAFHNHYDDVVSVEGGLAPFDLRFDNGLVADASGIEATVDWRPADWWRLQGNYSFLNVSAEANAGASDPRSIASIEGSSPKKQWSLRSSMDFGDRWEVDLWLYGVSRLAAVGPFADQSIDAYASLGVRVSCKLTQDLQIALQGHDLLDARRLQFVSLFNFAPTEVERVVSAQIVWGR